MCSQSCAVSKELERVWCMLSITTGSKVRVTIWGNKVDMYQKLMKNKEALGATLIITSVNPKTYSDGPTHFSNNSKNHPSDDMWLQKEVKKEFTIEGKIIKISSRNGWNYISCNHCAKILQKMDGKLICKKCTKPDIVGILR
ncbi:hypothetical protein YC2023_119022 [Brassica napus]